MNFDKESKSRKNCCRERERERGGRHVGKVVDIGRITKNQNPGVLFFFFFSFFFGGGGAGRTIHGEVLAAKCKQLFLYVTHCINLIHIKIFRKAT